MGNSRHRFLLRLSTTVRTNRFYVHAFSLSLSFRVLTYDVTYEDKQGFNVVHIHTVRYRGAVICHPVMLCSWVHKKRDLGRLSRP